MTITEARPRRSGATAASRRTRADPGTPTLDLASGSHLEAPSTVYPEYVESAGKSLLDPRLCGMGEPFLQTF
jgi:hypothetical protein